MTEKLLWVALVVLLCAVAVEAQAYPDCAQVCTTSASCETECAADPGKGEGEATTCAEYGVCEGLGGGCYPSWVIISSQASGGFAVQSFFPPGCDYYGVTKYTWHDTNQCGDPDYQTCAITFHVFRSDYACCTYYWCGGDTCGFN